MYCIKMYKPAHPVINFGTFLEKRKIFCGTFLEEKNFFVIHSSLKMDRIDYGRPIYNQSVIKT